mgnify:CR=1 FL=1
MTIRLETSKRTGIVNSQEREISVFDLNWARKLMRQFPKAIPRTEPTALYNCHGLTFASRRTRIFLSSEIPKILNDDKYKEIDIKEAKGGDIVVYFDENGDANHSGIVVANTEYDQRLILPMICSKWGNGGEFIHGLNDCPRIYGPQTKFYRCAL